MAASGEADGGSGPARRRSRKAAARPVDTAVDRSHAVPLRREGDQHLPAGPKAKRTRAMLLEVASALFIEQGYQATSVAAIVTRAGVSFGTFYQYFGSRSDVVRALINQHVAHFVDRTAHWDGMVGPEVFPVMIADFVHGYAESVGLSAVWEEASCIDAEAADLRRDLSRVLVEGVEQQLLRGAAAGRSRELTPETARLTAVALSSMVDRFCYLNYVFDPPADGPPDPAVAAAVLTELWLGAIGAPAPAATGS